MDGTVIEIGNSNDSDCLKKLREKASFFRSMSSLRNDKSHSSNDTMDSNEPCPFKYKSSTCWHIYCKALKLDRKHANLVRQLHCRASMYLAATSDIIIMPWMETTKMVAKQKKQRKDDIKNKADNKGKLDDNVAKPKPCTKFGIRKVTKRALLQYAHCSFVNHLYHKCHAVGYNPRYNYQRSILLGQPEGYTSKTCAKCSHLNKKLGLSKIFTCPHPNCDYDANPVVHSVGTSAIAAGLFCLSQHLCAIFAVKAPHSKGLPHRQNVRLVLNLKKRVTRMVNRSDCIQAQRKEKKWELLTLLSAIVAMKL